MVRNHHMRPQGPIARFLQEAPPVVAAAATGTLLAQRSELPQEILVHAAAAPQLVHVAAGRLNRPRNGAGKRTHFGTVHLVLAVFQQTAQTAQTKVVGPPFDQRDAEGRVRPRNMPRTAFDAREHLLHQGQILVQQLRLQVARVGADHHRHVVPFRPEHRRQQIRHALAHAGAGLNQQMPRIIKGLHHAAKHFDLPRPRLIAGHQTGERPAGLQQRRNRLHVQRRAVRMRRHRALNLPQRLSRKAVLPATARPAAITNRRGTLAKKARQRNLAHLT